MSDAVFAIFRAIQALFAEERAEITHRLWQSLPNVKDELFTYYEQELFEDICDRIEFVRQYGPQLTPSGVELCERALGMSHADRLDLVHLLWQSLPSMYGLFGLDDPEFRKELDRRIADAESGKTKGIPHEEVMARLKEKYG